MSMLEERIRKPISTKELERRWAAVRAEMKAQQIDALITQNDNMFMGGYFRWFTGIAAETAYPKSVFFPLNDEMTLVGSGGLPLPPSPPEWAVRGVKERLCKPYFRTLSYTNTYDAGIMVDKIKEYGCKKVGFVGVGMMGAAFYTYINENAKGVEFVDATDLVDEIKAVKSEEELSLCLEAARIQDMVCAAMPTIIRPYKFEYQIRSEIKRILEDLGSEEQLMMMGSSSPGVRTGHFDTFFQNRQVLPGDQVFVMIEVNGPGGMYGEIGRTWCLGEPPAELLRCWTIALEAQQLAATKLVPGANPADIIKANNDFMEAHGFAAEHRLFAHGQGYDLVERPALTAAETMKLKENMFLAVHPICFNDEAYAFSCDNFVVTKQGGVKVHKTPQEIIVLDC